MSTTATNTPRKAQPAHQGQPVTTATPEPTPVTPTTLTVLPSTSEAVAKLDPKLAKLRQVATDIDHRVSSYLAELKTVSGHFDRMMVTSSAIACLRAALTPEVMASILPLMNQDHGFLTDHTPSAWKEENRIPYPVETVKECLITAVLQGFLPTGNEFNIIAGRFYPTKNGYARKVREFPGLTDLSITPGVPTQREGQTLVKVAVAYRLDGHPRSLKGADGQPGRVFVVPMNKGMGMDGAQGKAVRRALKAVWEELLGQPSDLSDDDVSELSPEKQLAAANRTQQVERDLLALRPGANVGNGTAGQDKPAGERTLTAIRNLTEELEMAEDRIADLCDNLGFAFDGQWTQAQAEQLLAALEAKRGG